MITVKTLKILKAIKQREEGEIAIVEDEEKVYQCKDGQWIEYKNDDGLKLSLYDINKQAVMQLPDLEEDDIANSAKTIRQYISDTAGTFYMLLCKDLNYYTILWITGDGDNLLENEAISCLQELGTIKSIEYDKENGVIENWIVKDDEPVVAYLFNYDGGIIECL